MIPRDYQVRAYDAVLDSLRRGHNPIAAIATGGGKSLLLSMLVDKFRSNGGYSLVLANSKELIVQNMRSMRLYRGLDGIGVYSAGLNHNTIGTAATYGTIQTIYRNLHRLPEVDVVLVDEVQNVAHKNSEAKMYNALMAHFPNARKIGVSATPYRLDKGLVYQGDGCHFDDLAIEIGPRRLAVHQQHRGAVARSLVDIVQAHVRSVGVRDLRIARGVGPVREIFEPCVRRSQHLHRSLHFCAGHFQN